MAAPPTKFSELSAARQKLVRLCQSTNYGHVQELSVRDRELVFNGESVVLMDLKLDAKEDPRPKSQPPTSLYARRSSG